MRIAVERRIEGGHPASPIIKTNEAGGIEIMEKNGTARAMIPGSVAIDGDRLEGGARPTNVWTDQDKLMDPVKYLNAHATSVT